jgi:exodeoxyribonuclease V alpha subunit
MLRNDHFDVEELGEVFDESDRLLADASLRLAARLGSGPLEVSPELYRALLLLAKAVRHNHAAVDLEPVAFGRLLEELWTVRDDEGQFEFVGGHVDAAGLVAALGDADPRLVGREALEAGEVAPGGAPIVLSTAEGAPRYATIRRYAAAECAIANRLLASVAEASTFGADQVPLPTAAELEAHADPTRLSDELRAFLDRAVTRSASVLTGGPGTGKTTAIAMLLRSMGMVARERGRPFRVAICAPTAKAAVRMREALDQAFGDKGMAEFAEELLIDPNSGSVHRLLEIRPDASVSRVELHCDLVIVDEVSMLEMTLLDQLLRCAGESHVILVGDPDQLVSVEVGAVLRDIVEAGATPGSPLEPVVTRLVTSHRSNEAIVQLARAINAGSMDDVAEAIAAHPDELLRSATPSEQLGAVLESAMAVRTRAEAGDVDGALDLLGHQVVLCGNREGEWSVAWWRAKVEEALARTATTAEVPSRFPVGTPLMVLKNEQSATKELAERLSNGDVGVVCQTDDGPEAYFLPGGDSPRHRPLRVIDEATPAWSFTIHKSQGSEYQRVIVSLPSTKNRILTKELLYTAVTRAKHEVVIVGSDEVLAAALDTTVQRVSGLTERLAVRTT